MKELIGEHVIRIGINDDQSILCVETRRATFLFKTYAECCSETWFSDIIGAKYLIGATVKKVENLDLELINYNLDDNRCRQDEDIGYGIKLITDKGEANIIYRNSSNGYYGGSMYMVCELSNLNEITEDWQA